jgi:oligopeptide/dipeptide ABC transporter ATP-binding protein
MSASSALVSVEHLTTRFFTSRGVVGAVEDVSLHIDKGEAVGVVGESGSGKSMTALSILRLVPMPGRVVSGRVMFCGEDLLALSEEQMRRVRRADIAMVFQDPSNFLNPIMPIGEQIAEGLDDAIARRVVRGKVVEALRAVRIPDAERVVDYYPFQMSGGMQQRAVIAAAIARQPSLVIADEPTTALDATVQFQILRLLVELRTATNAALMLISHDLSVIASVCSRVYVMYAAEIVEAGTTRDVYADPAHPYTRALLGSILDPLHKPHRLTVLAGSIPDLVSPPFGCRFHPRCPHAMPVCGREIPPFVAVAPGHTVRCWLHVAQEVAA